MKLRMVIPKGRQQARVVALLNDAGIFMAGSARDYRPASNDPSLEIKLLKSQNIPPLVGLGQHDCGFAGKDWIAEQGEEVLSLLDLGFDPVRLVACIPESWDWPSLQKRPLIAASEYRRLCCEFLTNAGVSFTFVQSFGATEVFPPEDADLIVDNTSSGATLRENRLKIVAELLHSSTCFVANRDVLDDPGKRARIEDLLLVFKSVLLARERVLLEMNSSPEALDRLVALLPAMKAPTIAKLYRQAGFALKAAVPKDQIKDLLPKLRAAGATDILETPIRKAIP